MGPRAASRTHKRTSSNEIFDIVPESDCENPKRRTKRKPNERRRAKADLEHSSTWFQKSVAEDLWMPEKMELESVRKPTRPRKQRPSRRSHHKHWQKGKAGKHWQRPASGRQRRERSKYVRERVPEGQRSIEPLLTSWFDVDNFADEHRPIPWRTNAMPPAPVSREIIDELTDLGVFGEDESKVNSVVKLRLYPTKDQKEKLDQTFAANRAVYNKLVGMSKDDRATRLATRDKTTRMTLTQLGEKYRPIARLETMNEYFRNKKGLARHRQVPDEVRDSAYQDFMKAVKSSIAGFFAKLERDESTSYPDMRFKSKFARSNSIQFMARSFTVVHDRRLRFKPKYFGFGEMDGIEMREQLPELTMSVRLQRLREGEYSLIVPQKREFPRSETDRVCAIDPGIRNFVTVYDPEGRTFSVKDSRSTLKKKFEAVDTMKATLSNMDNESKARHPDKVRTRRKRGRRHSKTKQHRQRYRLRRRIRLTSRKATRVVNDMHHKLACWLSSNYYNVLLPSFQTSEMVQKYLVEVASDATPETSSDEERVAIQKRKMSGPTARAMMAHYRFKMLLKYKMARAGGRVIDCEEEYTSKTCSACGEIKHNLGGNHVFRCASCHAVLDRDVSAAKNIFHKNMSLLG